MDDITLLRLEQPALAEMIENKILIHKDEVVQIITELKKYRDDIANGKMINIIYPVGEKLYFPVNEKEIVKCEVMGYHCRNKDNKFSVMIYHDNKCELVDLTRFNKTAKSKYTDVKKMIKEGCEISKCG